MDKFYISNKFELTPQEGTLQKYEITFDGSDFCILVNHEGHESIRFPRQLAVKISEILKTDYGLWEKLNNS